MLKKKVLANQQSICAMQPQWTTTVEVKVKLFYSLYQVPTCFQIPQSLAEIPQQMGKETWTQNKLNFQGSHKLLAALSNIITTFWNNSPDTTGKNQQITLP